MRIFLPDKRGVGPFLYLLLAVILLAMSIGASIVAETMEPGANAPTREELAQNNELFLNLARKAFKWDEPAEPVKIAGPLYFVGTKGLGAYLLVTAEGNILLNTGMPGSGPMILESIRKLGFNPEDTKWLINGHAHSDHAGAFAYIKEQTGAQVAIMQEDVACIEDGGQSDFRYGDDAKVMGFAPCKVDRQLRDGDVITMGDVRLTAHHTPGHTRGSTTWVATMVDRGKSLMVIWPDGGSVNPGYRLLKNPSYPGIAEDYRRTYHFWEMQKPDIFLAAHTEYFDFADKQSRAGSEGTAAWINPEEFRRFVAAKRQEFERLLALEAGAATPADKPKE